MGLRGPKSKYVTKAEKLLARRMRYQQKKIDQEKISQQLRYTNPLPMP